MVNYEDQNFPLFEELRNFSSDIDGLKKIVQKENKFRISKKKQLTLMPKKINRTSEAISINPIAKKKSLLIDNCILSKKY